MRFAIWYYLKSLTVRLFVMKKCSPITIFGIFRISVRVTRKVGLAVLAFRWSTHKAAGGPNTT